MRDLSARFEFQDERLRATGAMVQRTTAIGVTLLFVGMMINFTRSLLGGHWPDPFWGLLLVFCGLGVQLFGLAQNLERLG